MIVKGYIERNLHTLDALFKKPGQGPLTPQLYAKLSIIEVGGWTEITMDELVLRVSKSATDQNYIKKVIIKPVYGFDYDGHFRKMLIKAIGVMTVERIEKKLDQPKFLKLKSSLGLLKTARDSHAHTYVKTVGATSGIVAPSVALSYFQDIYTGLKDVHQVMRSMKLL